MQLPRYKGSALWYGHGADPHQLTATPRSPVAAQCSRGRCADDARRRRRGFWIRQASQSQHTKRRTHSLFRQGCLDYQFIPTMQEARLRPLMEKFGQLMLKQPLFADIYGLI